MSTAKQISSTSLMADASGMKSARDQLFQKLSNRCLPVKVCRKGTWVFTQGDALDSLYIVREGTILLTRSSSCGRETILGFAKPGEFFGDVSLLSGQPAPFNAFALQKSVLLVMHKSEFRQLLEDPSTCRALTEVIANRCNEAWTHIEALGSGFLGERIRTMLSWLGQKMGVETGDGVEICMSQAHLAQMVGVSRESLNRQLSILKEEGAIKVSRKRQQTSLLILEPGKFSTGCF